MTVSIEDIDRWDAGDVREVFNATRNRAEAAFEASNGIAELPAFGTWGGEASEAAKESIGQTRKDLDAHGNEALAVAQAARKAADDVDAVKASLAQLRADASSAGFEIDPIGNQVLPGPALQADMVAMLAAESTREALQARLNSVLTESARVDQELAAAIGMATGTDAIPATPHDNSTLPQPTIDPQNPFVGDERFGHWQNVIPPPYTGDTPPAPWTGHRSLEGMPGKGPAGPSGFYTPGRTWVTDDQAPMVSLSEQYQFRISGEDCTKYTRMVGGQQQQWVQYTYDARRYTQVDIGAEAWASTDPDASTRTPGGVITGGLAGITPPPKIEAWKPISLPQITSLSDANPTATYYIPNGCGGQFTFSGGAPTGGVSPAPVIPSMTAGR